MHDNLLSDASIDVFQYSSTIMVHVEIVRRGEHRDNRRELFRPRLAEHDVSASRTQGRNTVVSRLEHYHTRHLALHGLE